MLLNGLVLEVRSLLLRLMLCDILRALFCSEVSKSEMDELEWNISRFKVCRPDFWASGFRWSAAMSIEFERDRRWFLCWSTP